MCDGGGGRQCYPRRSRFSGGWRWGMQLVSIWKKKQLQWSMKWRELHMQSKASFWAWDFNLLYWVHWTHVVVVPSFLSAFIISYFHSLVSASHTVFSFSLDLCDWYQFSSEQSWRFNWSSLIIPWQFPYKTCHFFYWIKLYFDENMDGEISQRILWGLEI